MVRTILTNHSHFELYICTVNLHGMKETLLIIMAYLIGSIPTSIWISRYIFKFDIRDYGSGNAGATNTFRILGPKWGSFVMLVDVTKGIIATSLYIFSSFYLSNEIARVNFMIVLGLASVVGHIFPLYANFKGGKGVATLLGMAIALQPTVAFICILIFAITLLITRFVSLSSMLASITFMVLILFIYKEQEVMYRMFAIVVALMVLVTHQKNIGRLWRGTEHKISLMRKKDKKAKK